MASYDFYGVSYGSFGVWVNFWTCSRRRARWPQNPQHWLSSHTWSVFAIGSQSTRSFQSCSTTLTERKRSKNMRLLMQSNVRRFSLEALLLGGYNIVQWFDYQVDQCTSSLPSFSFFLFLKYSSIHLSYIINLGLCMNLETWSLLWLYVKSETMREN